MTVATINFCSPRGKSSNPLSKPFKHAKYLDGEEEEIALEPVQIEIKDLRGELQYEVPAKEQLAARGFAVLKHDFGMTYEEIRTPEGTKAYMQQTAELVKKLLGATDIIAWNEAYRKTDPQARADEESGDFKAPETPIPAGRAHVDQDESCGRQQIRDHGMAWALESGNRGMIVNVWRPIKGPVEDCPLAMCDYTTLDKKNDLGRSTDFFGSHFSIRHSDGQRWYYLHNQMPDEIILLQCYDSEEGSQGKACFTPHTAFFDEKRLDTKQPRESMEVRHIVGFRNAA